jgi:predicted negative regulator of RcsB-dependent stress response
MDEYMSEKEQVEALREWWKENGRYVIAGLVVGIAGVVGWQQWQLQQERVAQAASDSYEAVTLAVDAGDAASASALAAALREAYPRTPYAAQAALMAAKAWVAEGELATAATELAWAMENSGDVALTKVARLRLARVQLSMGEVAAAEATLAIEDEGAFAPLFAEVRGDVAFARGDLATAREAYQTALDGMVDGVGDRQSVEMKLRDVTLTAVGEVVQDAPIDPDGETQDTGADG